MFMIDVVDVRPLGGHKIEITFKDGLTATVDLDRVIKSFEGVSLLSQTRSTFDWSAWTRRSVRLSGPTAPTCVQMFFIPTRRESR